MHSEWTRKPRITEHVRRMAQCTDRMAGMDRDQIRNAIEQGNTALGIEFGSTRIKAVLVDGKNKPIAQGSYDWDKRFEEGIWT